MEHMGYLVGGFNPSEKLSVGMMTLPRYGTVKNVPNHQQPVWLWLVMVDYGWQCGYASLGYSLWGKHIYIYKS
jgi:hypothetical protein